MKFFVSTILLLISFFTFSQQDSLKIDERYLEDQLYIGITYNVLNYDNKSVNNNGFSYGVSAGFIKDIVFNKQRNFGLGIGVGYGFDTFDFGLKVVEANNSFSFQVDNTLPDNKLRLHTVEFPLEIRWRNSTLTKYNFFRVYAGVKISYNFSNNFVYINDTGTKFRYKNVPNYNNWQTGLTLSVGYSAFNLYAYYGVNPLLENSVSVNAKMLKFGLIFYIL